VTAASILDQGIRLSHGDTRRSCHAVVASVRKSSLRLGTRATKKSEAIQKISGQTGASPILPPFPDTVLPFPHCPNDAELRFVQVQRWTFGKTKRFTVRRFVSMESGGDSLVDEFVDTLHSAGDEMAAKVDNLARQELKIHREFERHKTHLAELSGRERQLQDYAEELMQVQATIEQDKRTAQRKMEKKTKRLENLRARVALKQQEVDEQSAVL
jgi:hypothetical protein